MVYAIFSPECRVIPQETDPNTKRNAFVSLMNTKPALAVQYLTSVINQAVNFDELLQLSIIELIRKDCRSPQADKVNYVAWFDLIFVKKFP
jgi:coatomer subunit beta